MLRASFLGFAVPINKKSVGQPSSQPIPGLRFGSINDCGTCVTHRVLRILSRMSAVGRVDLLRVRFYRYIHLYYIL